MFEYLDFEKISNMWMENKNLEIINNMWILLNFYISTCILKMIKMTIVNMNSQNLIEIYL